MRPSEVGEYLTAQGRCFASSEELCALLGVAPAVLPSSLRRAVARGDFVKVCRGGGGGGGLGGTRRPMQAARFGAA